MYACLPNFLNVQYTAAVWHVFISDGEFFLSGTILLDLECGSSGLTMTLKTLSVEKKNTALLSGYTGVVIPDLLLQGKCPFINNHWVRTS